MRSQTYGTHSSTPLQMIVCFIILVVVTTAISSCGKETIFPPEPPAHRLLKEMEKWPDEYYWLIEAGVASRIMGIRVGGESIQESLQRVDKLVSQVKADWSNIAELDTAAKLIDYLRKHNLEAIAESIEETLAQNKAREPGGEFHSQLQAQAIKRGLISSYREVQKELGS